MEPIVAFGVCALAFCVLGIISVALTLAMVAWYDEGVHEIEPVSGGMWPTMDWRSVGVAKYKRMR